MGRRRDRVVTEPRKIQPGKTEPDEELLEFLGGIDEVNDESQEQDFSDFLASSDIGRLAPEKPTAPVKAKKE
jgi:hypothetical protein